MVDFDSFFFAKLAVIGMLYVFLPLTAFTYYFFRRPRRYREIERVLDLLNIESPYRDAFKEENPAPYFFVALAYASAVSAIGLTLLAFSPELGIHALPRVELHGVEFPQEGTWLVSGVAFLGAYLWGLQYVYRRYTQNDIVPAVFYALGMRMIMATVVALVLYNAAGALTGTGEGSAGITANLWPAIALVVGMFPQRGLDWLGERVPIIARRNDPTVRLAPLEMIEGVGTEDRIRLQEVGIDTCYDLAVADFVPLALHTPYGARELVDWILQAKLCVCFGSTVKDLREHGIRTIIDLAHLDDDTDLEAIAVDTPLTRSALVRARDSVKKDPEIERLQDVGSRLGRFVGQARPSTHVGGGAEAR
jgi:hypothetical protein